MKLSVYHLSNSDRLKGGVSWCWVVHGGIEVVYFGGLDVDEVDFICILVELQLNVEKFQVGYMYVIVIVIWNFSPAVFNIDNAYSPFSILLHSQIRQDVISIRLVARFGHRWSVASEGRLRKCIL